MNSSSRPAHAESARVWNIPREVRYSVFSTGRKSARSVYISRGRRINCADIHFSEDEAARTIRADGLRARKIISSKCDCSKSEDDINSKNCQYVFFKNLNAVFHLTRPFTSIGTIVAVTFICFLPLRNLGDLTPTFFLGVVKALVPAVLMNIYVQAINQMSDVEIDKINKPDLPLASGDLSMKAVFMITLTCPLMSLALGIILGSPLLVMGLMLWFLLGSTYSIQLPFLTWKGNAFLAAISIMIGYGFGQTFFFFIHIQKYVLGRPMEFTRPLIFASAVVCCLSLATALLKDLPDVDGDRKFGVQTFSVLLGKERVFWAGVYILLFAYGGAVIFGAFSSLLLSKLVTIICHSTLAFFLWLRVRTVDLSNNESTLSFYMFIWKLFCAEYFLIHFVR